MSDEAKAATADLAISTEQLVAVALGACHRLPSTSHVTTAERERKRAKDALIWGWATVCAEWFLRPLSGWVMSHDVPD